MEQKFFLNKEISELFSKNIIKEPLTEKNLKLKNGFFSSTLLWFSTYSIGASVNLLNKYLAGGTMPKLWDSWSLPNHELFSGSFKWAFKSFSHFFGDWIVFGNIYAFSLGDLLLLGSFVLFIVYFSKTLYQYFKK